MGYTSVGVFLAMGILVTTCTVCTFGSTCHSVPDDSVTGRFGLDLAFGGSLSLLVGLCSKLCLAH